MNDAEVVRLRRLRGCALRSRAIARAMAANPQTSNDPLLIGGVGSSWRIARAVSGKLKAHPNVRRQADVGFASRWHHGVLAALQLFKGGTRSQVLREYLVLMRQLSRQLDDARSLTLSADLSDTFGRAQTEINALMLGLARETCGARPIMCPRGRACSIGKHAVGPLAAPFEGEWPYLSSGPRSIPPQCALPACLGAGTN
jgi:hypothetical protein